MSAAFRKIDIDAYDEDVLLESELYEPDPRAPAIVLNDAKQKSTTVRSLLAKGDNQGALQTILTQAPYGPSVEEAKVLVRSVLASSKPHITHQNLTLQTIVQILNSTKSTNIPVIVKALDSDAQDTLMKYIYKGMGMPGWGEVSGSVLLIWHEKLTEIAGTGCIVRVMTDRRTV